MAPEIIMLFIFGLIIKTDLKIHGTKGLSNMIIAFVSVTAILIWGGFFNDTISLVKRIF